MWKVPAVTVLSLFLFSGCYTMQSNTSPTEGTTLPEVIDRDAMHPISLYSTSFTGNRHTKTPSSSKNGDSHPPLPTRIIDLSALPDLDGSLPLLTGKRLLLIGETHTRLADHLNQLAIIQGLYHRGKDIAIGVEFFQQPFQAHLDDFIFGGLEHTDLLSRTEYYDRWGYDYRLYEPIMEFTRERGIPLVALNVSSEIVKKVSTQGWDGAKKTLTPSELAQFPQTVDRRNKYYEQRLRKIFEQHSDVSKKDFQRFLDVQLLWDEGMAKSAAKYLVAHPDRTLVVLAGAGHLSYGDGIPSRVKRRTPVDAAIILPATGIELDSGISSSKTIPNIADLLLVAGEQELPPAGILGVTVETKPEGVQIASFTPKSPAEMAGMEQGDRLLKIGTRTIKTTSDVKVALWDKRPGEQISVAIYRSNWFSSGEKIRFKVKLGK